MHVFQFILCFFISSSLRIFSQETNSISSSQKINNDTMITSFKTIFHVVLDRNNIIITTNPNLKIAIKKDNYVFTYNKKTVTAPLSLNEEHSAPVSIYRGDIKKYVITKHIGNTSLDFKKVSNVNSDEIAVLTDKGLYKFSSNNSAGKEVILVRMDASIEQL